MFSVAGDKMRDFGKSLTAQFERYAKSNNLHKIQKANRRERKEEFLDADKCLKITTPCKSEDLQGVRQPSPRTAYA
jgi:hypothetical protein